MDDQAPEPQINVVDPDTNEVGSIPHSQFQQAVAQGYRQAAPEEVDSYFKNQEFGTTGQQIATGAEGAAQGLIGAAAPAAEIGLGITTPERIRARTEINPGVHAASEAGGFGLGMLAGTGEAALVGKLGEGAAALAGLGEASSVGARLAAGATRLGTEMALIQANDEGTKAITGVHESVGDIAANIGLSAILGAATGGAFSGAGMLGGKALETMGITPEGLQDFKDRLKYRASGVNPNEASMHELEQNIGAYRNVGSDAGGFSGLKGAAIQKVLPKSVTPEIAGSVQDIAEKAQSAINDMKKQGVPDRLIQKYRARYTDFLDTVTNPAASVMDHFDAVNDFKKDLADFSKGNYGPFSVAPHEEAYDFLNITKNLGHDIRVSMEDPAVWGKDTANLQKSLNSTWSGAKKYVEQTESKLMSKVGDSLVSDPAKFNTYFNQAGKAASPTVRQQIMDGFVTKMEAFHDAVGNAYEKAGLELPDRPSLTALRASVDKPSVASRLADAWYDKMASKALGTGIGAGALGGAGHLTGIPGLGYAGTVIGGKLGESILPSFIQPLLEKAANHAAFEQSVSYGKNVLSGDSLLNSAVNGVFSGAKTIPQHLMPSSEKTEKLDKKIKGIQANQQSLLNGNNALAHYMPNHASAVSQAATNAVNVLASKQPSNPKQGPLDEDFPASADQKSEYKRTLEIAQQPLMVLHHLQQGTLSPQDVGLLRDIYPNYFQKVTQRLMSGLVDHTAKGESVPYKMRAGISLLLGQPVDGTFTPQAIQAAQATFAQKSAQQQAAAPVSKSKGQKMSKLADNYRTAEQSLQARKEKA